MTDSIKIIPAQYRDGQPIDFISNIFTLTKSQENNLQKYVSKHTSTEMKDHPYKMEITSQQKEQILNFHKKIMIGLKKQFNIEKNEDLAKEMIDKEIIIFSAHALERLKERFSSSKKDKGNPFFKLYSLKNISIPSEILQQDAVTVFIAANQIENKVSWGNTPYCVINYSFESDQTVLSVETQFNEAPIKTPYIIITIMKKKYKNI